MSRKRVGQGSAKDLYTDSDYPKSLILEFTNRVSVFDYGALPEEIPQRGAALRDFAIALMKHLREVRVPTLFDEKLSASLNAFVMSRASHPKFASDEKLEWEFVPLEIIFRLGAPIGSSLLSRSPGLMAGTLFSDPKIEFTTKLESSDRLLSLSEAASLVGGPERLAKITKLATECALKLREYFANLDMTLWDGKLEFARNIETGAFALVDAITPDELRLSFEGHSDVPLSKELLRSWLSPTDWGGSVAGFKRQYPETFRDHCASPPRLGPWRTMKFSTLFTALAEAVRENNARPIRNWFSDDSFKPKVFVLGQGGRETALRWRLEKEGAEIADAPDVADAVLVGKDSDLEAGVVDEYLQKGFWTFGPRREAAKLEWSKAFGRKMAAKAGIPIPEYSTRPEDLKKFSSPPVIKCDGLAAGKGVVVPKSFDEAQVALDNFSTRGAVVLEEQLKGFEASLFYLVQSGYQEVSLSYLGSAQDFKRRFAGDEGPNTGGMGAYVPHPKVGAADILQFEVWARSLATQMVADGTPFHGILYMGLMKDEAKGWRLLEFNARFGDPETQALVVALDDSKPYFRQMLQLAVGRMPRSLKTKHVTTCLALVRAEYPDVAKDSNFKLAEWNLKNESVEMFRSGALGGRVAYLVGRGVDLFSSGDSVFSALVESPWKNQLEWRADILP